MAEITSSERARIAEAVGLSDQYLYQFLTKRRQAPPEHCQRIERASGGRICVEQLRSDVRWHRVVDPTWPHPDGRPLLDVSEQ